MGGAEKEAGIHMVHQKEGGELLVVAVMFEVTMYGHNEEVNNNASIGGVPACTHLLLLTAVAPRAHVDPCAPVLYNQCPDGTHRVFIVWADVARTTRESALRCSGRMMREERNLVFPSTIIFSCDAGFVRAASNYWLIVSDSTCRLPETATGAVCLHSM